MAPPEIFDRQARRIKRDRMLHYEIDDRWLIDRMAADLTERLDGVKRSFARALILGSDLGFLRFEFERRAIAAVTADPSPSIAAQCDGVACDEDRLPFVDSSFDLVVAIGSLDTVNDLPGALLLIRRLLRPEGLFLGCMMGAGSLESLRRIAGASPVARFHPQIDVRSAGDLLGRAGFHLPVAENENILVRYPSISRLGSDLRANGLSNVLVNRRALPRQDFVRWRHSFDGGLVETFSIVTLTGWAPFAK